MILYSYAPGTGGDHVVKLLSSTADHAVVDRLVPNPNSLKYVEHDVLLGLATAADVIQELNNLKSQGAGIVGCHYPKFYQNYPAVKIRATWTRDDVARTLTYRNLITVHFETGVKFFYPDDHVVSLMMQYPGLSPRKKLLKFVQYYGLLDNTVNFGFEPFNIDRIFTMDFVNDLAQLAQRLGLQVDVNYVKQQHEIWLDQNPAQDFTLTQVVRYLEQPGRSWF